MIRTAALGALGLLFIGAAIVGINTWRFVPEDIAGVDGVILAPAPQIDLNAAAANLGAAIRFQTISHQNPADNKWDKTTVSICRI